MPVLALCMCSCLYLLSCGCRVWFGFVVTLICVVYCYLGLIPNVGIGLFVVTIWVLMVGSC